MSSHPTNSIPNSLQTPFFSDESESDHESGLLATCKPPNPHPDQVNREEDLSGVLEAGIESEELEDDIQARDTLLNEQVIKSGYLLKRSQKRTVPFSPSRTVANNLLDGKRMAKTMVCSKDHQALLL